MAGHYTKKKSFSGNGLGKRTVFNNIFELPFTDNTKKYYGIITREGKGYLYTYTCKIRTEAIEFFHELARLSDAKFDGKLHVFKN
jgi:hypothetical protein